MSAKAALRKSLLEKLKSISQEELALQSKAVCTHAFELLSGNEQGVSIFLSKSTEEIQTGELVHKIRAAYHNVTIYVPTIIDKTTMAFVALKKDENIDAFERDKWDIPILPTLKNRKIANGTEIDVIFTPAVGFDVESFHRLGRGRGYYDRIFKLLDEERSLAHQRQKSVDPSHHYNNTPIKKVGLSLNQQILVNVVPFDEHDVRLNVIISPGGVKEYSVY